MERFYSHGKLLLTGEYLVLDGAKALAIPTRFGQSLSVETNSSRVLKWISLDTQNTVWFETEFELHKIGQPKTEQDPITKRLFELLSVAKTLNKDFLCDSNGYSITTSLEFPKIWGLGTSSTLVNNIANWAKIDPYALLHATFGGSGYDIACASLDQSLTYQLMHNDSRSSLISADYKREVRPVDFNPIFKDKLYFVHLNQKQNSRDAIAQYRDTKNDLSPAILRINSITERMINCDSIHDFQILMDEHEDILSNILSIAPVKERLFKDFNGSIKSLGAWGGDFVMVAAQNDPTAYFKDKGFETIVPYSKMSL